MAKYKNNTGSDLSFADGTVLQAYNVAEVEPKTVVEKAWVKEGMIEEIKAPEKAAPKKATKAKAKAEDDEPEASEE